MKVELLYFGECPNYEALAPKLRDLVAAEGVADDVEVHLVESIDEAERERFLGSPTVRVNGTDVDPGASKRTDFGLKCRLYRSEEGISGVPPMAWVIEAIRAETRR